MGTAQAPSPALLLLAAFSRHNEALQWARRRVEANWGTVALESPCFDFTETQYYEPSMGGPLRKVFFAMDDLIDPGRLAHLKHETNAWEGCFAAESGYPERRPLNLDPGYLTLGKLVLASTKDFCHRVYLARGIYAEVTLYYKHGRWQHHPWTFADYRREDYHRFFSECRRLLHQRLRKTDNP